MMTRQDVANSLRCHDQGPTLNPRNRLWVAFWFGAVAGGLELATVLIRSATDPRISMNMLRQNRHYLWMIPTSNLLLLGGAGLITIAIAWKRPRFADWLTWRILVGSAALAVLLNIEGLHFVASLTLSLGISGVTAPWIARRSARLVSIARLCVPVMIAGLIVAAVLWSDRVVSAERRALAALPAPRAGTPNVLLIVLDDVRASSMSLYGRTRQTTPNLERFAESAVVFSHARPTASWTLPSHASMFTGQWPHALSVGWDRPLDATYPTLAEVLAREGFGTAGFVGNTYYGNALYGLGRGFARYTDTYENEEISLFEVIRSSGVGRRILQRFGHSIHVAEGGTSVRKSAAMINRDVLDWLDSRDQARPFFVFVNYYDAHSPFLPPENEGPRFGYGAISGKAQVEILKRLHRLESGRSLPGDGPADTIQQEAATLLRDSYESCIAYLDRQVGRLFEALAQRGVLHNTLVIITSDHGEHLKERGFCGHGLSLYREEVHVPLLVIPPGKPTAGRVVDAPVSLRELAATTVDLVGLPGRSPFPGKSLARMWRDDPHRISDHAPVLSEVDHLETHAPTVNVPASLGTVKSVLADGKVYIRNGNGSEELYDLITDPREERNLVDVAAHRASVARLRKTLDQMTARPQPDTFADLGLDP
jgi:arylsulfatase A-like enzyme